MATRLQVNLRFNGPQLKAWQATGKRRSVFNGWGRGVGKSWYTRTAWWLLVAQYDGKLRAEALKPFRGVRITVMMPTLVQFKDVHLSGIENDLGPDGDFHWLGAKIDRQRGHIKFPGGSWVKAFPASAYNARTARGMRTDVLCVDEVDDIDAEVYDSVAIPWMSEPWSLGMELAAGTPTRGRHGLWFRMLQAGKQAERFRTGQLTRDEVLAMPSTQSVIEVVRSLPEEQRPADPEEFALQRFRDQYAFHATYRDAPETVSAIAVANARIKTPEATFKREWEADPDAGEGLVYAFDDDFHVRESPPLTAFSEILIGVDHGWEDPGVFLYCGLLGHGNDAQLWVFAEEYEPAIANSVWNQRALAWKGRARFFPDGSRPDRVNDFQSLGLDVCNVDRGPGSILAGIARVADLLHIRKVEQMGPAFQPVIERRAKLYVDPRCMNTIREFGTYRRAKNPEGSFYERPEDKNNHAMDALRYVALGRFGRLHSQRHESQR